MSYVFSLPPPLQFQYKTNTFSFKKSKGLVHIPRTRLPSLSHHVTKQLLSPSPTYLNITSNSIELSIFAEESSLHELSQVAKRDKRLSKGSSSYSNGSGGGGALNFDKVEISEERWKVLIVESHDDHLGELVGPLISHFRLSDVFE
jgi:hypothetical protein